MGKLRVLYTREQIQKKVASLARQIQGDYQGKSLLVIGLLKGGFIFMADLVRELDLSLEIDFVRLASYGAGTATTGRVRLLKPLRTPIRGRDVLVVEDIVDSGFTLGYFLDYLGRRRPASLRVCALFNKPSRRLREVPVHYCGFTLPDAFVVGYGLDYAERYRNLPDLCVLESETAGDTTKGGASGP